MTKCPSCGAALDPHTQLCKYCGTAGEHAMGRPKPVTPEEMERQLRQAQEVVNRLMPAPMRWVAFLVPLIAVLIFLVIAFSMFRM